MGLFSKLFVLGIAAGAGYASVKIARKYDENKQKEIMDDEFDVATKKSTFENVKKAASDVYVETSEKVKSTVSKTAESIGIDTQEIGTAFSQAGTAACAVGKAVANASVKVAQKVKEEAPAVIDGTKEKVGTAVNQVKEVVVSTAEKITAKSDIKDAEVYIDEEDVTEVDETVVADVEVTENTEE